MQEQIQPQIKFSYTSHNPTAESQPWLSTQTRNIANPIVRFHNEIIDFATYVQPDIAEYEARLKVCREIEGEVKGVLENAEVFWPFLRNRMEMRGTELEIYVVSEKEEGNWQHSSLGFVQKISDKLGLKIYNLSVQISDQQCRITAEHSATKIEIWFRFVPQSWKLFITEMDDCVANSTEIRYLYLVFFCMLRQRSFHTVIRSLFIYGLCGFFIYERRNQRVRTLTENVMKFLEFFSLGIAQDKERKIFYKKGNIYRYTLTTDRILTFEIAQKVDIASPRKTKQFFKVFQNRYRVLGNYYYQPGTSVLAHLINPCHNKFFY